LIMEDIKILIIYTAAYILSFITGRAGLSALSAACLIGIAVFIYLKEKQISKELLNLRGLMALGLLGGEGIARLQLSNLSTDWTLSTWGSFYFFYLIFYFTSKYTEQLLNQKHFIKISSLTDSKKSKLFIFKVVILSVTFLSWVCFFFEAWKLQFIPLFTVDTPHAYSYFHLKGIHYFTTLAILIPGVTMLYIDQRHKLSLLPDIISGIGLFAPLILCVLLVSRFQFMFAAILAIFVTTVSGKKYKLWQILILGILLILVYVIITIERAHSVEYLNGIFEMKDPQTPIFITQPYMYIANNYDNFNVMTQELSLHSCGLKMLYPVITLTGLKFLFPSLGMAFPLFTNKEELTTVTLLYDAWYDFGIAGVIIFAIILGLVTGIILYVHNKDVNPFSRLIYAELAFYFSFSFFTTWFSNPATWFYLGFSVLFYMAYHISDRFY